MRILVVGQTYYPAANGQAVFTVRLAESLARLGHQVTVVIPSERVYAYRSVRHGVRIEALTALPVPPWYTDVHVAPFPRGHINQLLDTVRPHIVHIQDHYPLSQSVLRAAHRRRLPVVGTNHFLPENILHYVPLLRHYPAFLKRVLWWTMLDVFNQLDFVTTPTETAATILREQGIRVPVRAISCGVDADRFRPMPHVNRAQMRRRYHLDPNRTLFLYVGRIDQEKRLDVMLRALHRLRRDDVQLGIVGRGRHREALESMVHSLHLGQKVVFTGYVPDEDLPALLNSADAFVMPSEAELQSIATLEAMATGLPVVAANARALPELITHGTNGFLFSPRDTVEASLYMAYLADHPDRRREMGAASLARVHPHSLQYTVRHYEEVYRQVVLAPRPVPSARDGKRSQKMRVGLHKEV